MAQAVADAVGATKRQVQLWSDAGAIQCFPETDRQGRGRQRLYPRSELPFAAMAAFLARYQIPIGMIRAWIHFTRMQLASDIPGPGRKADWYRRAFRGEEESYMTFGAAAIEDEQILRDGHVQLGKLDRLGHVAQRAGLRQRNALGEAGVHEPEGVLEDARRRNDERRVEELFALAGPVPFLGANVEHGRTAAGHLFDHLDERGHARPLLRPRRRQQDEEEATSGH